MSMTSGLNQSLNYMYPAGTAWEYNTRAYSIVVATKCEPCILGYTKIAYKTGTKESEIVEFLNVTITESGCPGEQWAMIALKTYCDLEAGKKFEAADICCHDGNTN